MQNLLDRALGKYVIIEEIGRGGMGTVYKARDVELDRIVAIKVLSPYLVGEPQLVQRFIREARMAANLDHPHIVTIYDIGGEGGYYYFVMKHLEGLTLKELLAEEGPLPFDDMVRIVNQLASALDYAHEQALIHRDIKPGNVILDSEDTITLTDFGLAKVSENLKLTASGEAIGTLEYMAPEQARGEVDKASDIYSLGVMVYEMIAGRLPFKGQNQATLLYQHLHEPPPSMGKWRPDMPPEMEQIVLKAMAKDPVERYESAGELARELEQMAKKAWLAAPPRKPVQRQPDKEARPKRSRAAPRPARQLALPPMLPFLRRWKWFFLGGLALLVLLVSVLVFYPSLNQGPTPISVPAIVSPANAHYFPLVGKGQPSVPPPQIAQAELALLCTSRQVTPTSYLASWKWGQVQPRPWPGVPQGAVVHQFSWSPDGNWIVFAATTREGQTDLFRLRFDGTGLLTLTHSPIVESDPAWSPDGTSIAFSSGPEGSRDIALISIDGGTPEYLVQDPTDDWAPFWAPQGTRLTFVSNRDGNPEIYLLTVGSREVQRVTQSLTQDLYPVWSPQGQALAFLSNRDGPLQIYRTNLLGQDVELLASYTLWQDRPTWSPQGDWLAFTRVVGVDAPLVYLIQPVKGHGYVGPAGCRQPVWRPTPQVGN